MGVPNRLTALQQELLDAFFKTTQDFFLTGGAALAGFYLGHRETHDLDLFTLSVSLDRGVGTLRSVVSSIGAQCEETQTAPDFRRLLVSRGLEAVVVDLVFERVEQLHKDKRVVGIVRIDPADEIFANKVCALLGRAEIRDLVDVMALEQSGLSFERALADGQRKDGGLTAAQLAWVLHQVAIPVGAQLPGGTSAAELEHYRRDLVDRLTRIARP